MPLQGSREAGVVLQDTATVLWTTDGFGNVQAEGAFAKLQQIVVSSPTLQVNFNNIPQNFTNLKLVANFNFTIGSNLVMQLNGITGDGYVYSLMFASAGEVQGSTAEINYLIVGGSAGNSIIEIPSYANSPNGILTTGMFSQYSGGINYVGSSMGSNPSITSVTSINLLEQDGTGIFAEGSTFTLYGY